MAMEEMLDNANATNQIGVAKHAEPVPRDVHRPCIVRVNERLRNANE